MIPTVILTTVIIALLSGFFVYFCAARKDKSPSEVFDPYSEIQGSTFATSAGSVVITSLRSMDGSIILEDCDAYTERNMVQPPPPPENDDYI